MPKKTPAALWRLFCVSAMRKRREGKVMHGKENFSDQGGRTLLNRLLIDLAKAGQVYS